MIIRKLRLCLVEIEAFVNRSGQYIVSDLKNDEQAAEHVGRLFEVI